MQNFSHISEILLFLCWGIFFWITLYNFQTPWNRTTVDKTAQVQLLQSAYLTSNCTSYVTPEA